MSRCIKLGVSVCLIMTLNLAARTFISEIETLSNVTTMVSGTEILDGLLAPSGQTGTKTYTLKPIDWSTPTVNDTGDGISGMGPYYGLEPEEAWMAFDLSSIPDNAQIISASLSAYMTSYGIQAQRTLWYYPDDSWAINADPALSDPGDYIVPNPDTLVGTMVHNESQYTWKTINITHKWSNDLADNYVTFMLTGPQNGTISYGVIGLAVNTAWNIDKVPELVLTVAEDPNDYRVYKNVFDLGPEQIVKAGTSEINIGTYSVPSFADWNNDGLKDLIVGTGAGKVRIFLNTGTKSEPNFSNSSDKSFFAQADDSDLYSPPIGCMGTFPRVVYWDNDNKKDLLVGTADGYVKIFLNINTDKDPRFDGGTYLTYMYDGSMIPIDVGNRATPCVVDWNNDGRKDLVCGALDGLIHIFLNVGTDAEPIFYDETYAVMDDKSTLSVPSGRSSPDVLDLDFDGKKDLLTGNTDGQLLLYHNIGIDKAPVFEKYEKVDANDVTIDLAGTPRSRPFVCYWDNDGYPDVILGAGDGKVHLYRCKTLPADFNVDGKIDFTDWAIFTAYYSKTKYADKKAADLNNDGKVNIYDASWIAANWLFSTK